jgi:hypothetical protein
MEQTQQSKGTPVRFLYLNLSRRSEQRVSSAEHSSPLRHDCTVSRRIDGRWFAAQQRWNIAVSRALLLLYPSTRPSPFESATRLSSFSFSFHIRRAPSFIPQLKVLTKCHETFDLFTVGTASETPSMNILSSLPCIWQRRVRDPGCSRRLRLSYRVE